MTTTTLSMREEKSMEEELSYPIFLCERIRKSAEEADSQKLDCAEVGKRAERLGHMLRNLIYLASTSSSSSISSSSSASSTSKPASSSSSNIYDRPIRRIVAEAVKNLERALTLVRKCNRRASLLHRVFTITAAADFRKLLSLLDASLGDMRWLLSIFNSEDAGSGGIVLSLPPIASIDPILSWVWSYVAALHLPSSALSDRIEAANSLASLALDNNCNKKIIIEEGGVPPLLRLLTDVVASPNALQPFSSQVTSLPPPSKNPSSSLKPSTSSSPSRKWEALACRG